VTGKRYRLPSEAEWEYAARAGTRTRYWWGDAVGSGNANCRNCGSRWGAKWTAPAGSFRANRFGLYDVHGNVWEWVQDCRHANYRGAPTNGRVWAGGNCRRRVLRGGSWRDFDSNARSAVRLSLEPTGQLNHIGFRVARTLP
jgi:formylglycine-generating enzyme required for sulfatase activity